MPTVRMEEVERHLGARIALARRKAGLTQEKLGERLNCSFQQVQKYEKGINRISASALLRIGTLPVSWFFAGLTAETDEDIRWTRLDPNMVLGLMKLQDTQIADILRDLVLAIGRLRQAAKLP